MFYILFSLSLGIPADGSNGNGHSRCSMYAVNFTQILADGITKADPNWPIVSCQQGWEFDKNELPYPTISSEVNNIILSKSCFKINISKSLSV